MRTQPGKRLLGRFRPRAMQRCALFGVRGVESWTMHSFSGLTVRQAPQVKISWNSNAMAAEP